MQQKKLMNSPIHYWINNSNSNKSIIFIHPAFADHTCFDEQIKYFTNDFKIITLDLVGHGLSIGGKGSIIETANYINKIMEIENIDKINLVGVSIGAVLIQDFANKYPKKVSSLCCIGAYDINNFDYSLQKGNSGQQIKMMLKAIISIKWFAKDNKKISAYTIEAQERFYQLNLKFKKKSFRYLASLGQLINKQKTQNRNYPLLIGVGEFDNDMAIKASTLWANSEVNSRFVNFKNAGHIVNLDTPEEFNVTIKQILC